MDLSSITDKELLEKLTVLRGNEKKITLSILFHLIELERRKLFLELGFSSLFDYCVRKLGYSDGSAHRRIMGARCIRNNPELAEMFLQGKVTLCSIAIAAPILKAGKTSPAELIGKSKREVERMVAKEIPMAPKREVIKSVVVEAPKAPLFPTTPPVEKYEIRFTISKEVYERFEEAKAKLSNSLGSSLTVEGVFSKLLESYLRLTERKARPSNKNSRYIPRSVKREVYRRDKGTCSYVSPDGTGCCERKYLHFDHIQPFALGGKTEASNLRLLCSAHNRLQAEKSFGTFDS